MLYRREGIKKSSDTDVPLLCKFFQQFVAPCLKIPSRAVGSCIQFFFACFNICTAGDHMISMASIYGGTFNLFNATFRKMGIDVTFVDQEASDEELEKAFKPNTKLVFGETLSNPGVKVLDIERIAAIAHKHGVPLIIDNTFPTPVKCRPFEWGPTS